MGSRDRRRRLTPSRARNLSPWASWMLRLEEAAPTDPFPDAGDPAAIVAWRERAGARLVDLLGPRPERVPADVERTETVDCGAYRRERIVFDADATMSVPAYLLVPHDRHTPGPAVLAVHGHGPGKQAICAVDPGDGEDDGGRYAHDLATRGYVVLAPDLRCFGERVDWNPPEHYACDTNLVSAVMFGVNPLADNLWDLMAALDVLAAHELVDAGRLGAIGFSYGATATLFLAALDERVGAAVVSGYFSSWRDAHRVPWNMCGSQILFGMVGRLEHVDVAALVAPRPFLIESGSDDVLFPVAAARAGVARLERVYDALDESARRVEHHVFDGGHRYDGTGVPAFLERWL